MSESANGSILRMKPLFIDGLLAVTAIHRELTVATRNVKDFSVCNVPLINPWDS